MYLIQMKTAIYNNIVQLRLNIKIEVGWVDEG